MQSAIRFRFTTCSSCGKVLAGKRRTSWSCHTGHKTTPSCKHTGASPLAPRPSWRRIRTSSRKSAWSARGATRRSTRSRRVQCWGREPADGMAENTMPYTAASCARRNGRASKVGGTRGARAGAKKTPRRWAAESTPLTENHRWPKAVARLRSPISNVPAPSTPPMPSERLCRADCRCPHRARQPPATPRHEPQPAAAAAPGEAEVHCARGARTLSIPHAHAAVHDERNCEPEVT